MGRGRRRLEAGDQAAGGRDVEGGVPPPNGLDAVEPMVLDTFDGPGLQGAGVGRGPERPVAHVAPGSSGDLADFLRGQVTARQAVVLAQTGEDDVVHVQVEAHADGVRGDEVIDRRRPRTWPLARCACVD